MCSTPSVPKVEEVEPKVLATPTLADASVSKASTNTRAKTASFVNRNIKTSARGLLDDEVNTTKKGLLGE